MKTRISKPKKKITPETAIKKEVKHYLSLKGWFHFPITQGLGAYKGIPDIIAVKDRFMYAHVLFIEVKTEKGKLSEHQKKFKDRIEAENGSYLVIRSVEDLIKNGV